MPLSHRRDQLRILVVVIADHQSAVLPRQVRRRNRSGTNKRGALDSTLGDAEGRWDEESGEQQDKRGSSRNVQECRVRRRMEPPWVGAVYDSPECSATGGAGQGILGLATDFHGGSRITLKFLLMCVLRWIDDTMGFVHGSFFVLFPGGWYDSVPNRRFFG